MSHKKIKAFFSEAVHHTASDISLYAVDPGNLLPALNRTARFFHILPDAPSTSAFIQQRAKLKPEALEVVFHRFNSSVQSTVKPSDYRFFATDESTIALFSKHSLSSPEYFVSEGHSAKGFYSMHLNAFYDMQKHTYFDTLIQPVHHKDKFRAFYDMADRALLASSEAPPYSP